MSVVTLKSEKKLFWYSGWYCCELYGQDCFFRVGQSYGKKVLIEVESENDSILYEVGKYSQTTSKQVTQFLIKFHSVIGGNL